jgi:hypothetical protein
MAGGVLALAVRGGEAHAPGDVDTRRDDLIRSHP